MPQILELGAVRRRFARAPRLQARLLLSFRFEPASSLGDLPADGLPSGMIQNESS